MLRALAIATTLILGAQDEKARLVGRLEGPAGATFERIALRIVPLFRSPDESLLTRANADGTFRFDDLDTGTYRLYLESHGEPLPKGVLPPPGRAPRRLLKTFPLIRGTDASAFDASAYERGELTVRVRVLGANDEPLLVAPYELDEDGSPGAARELGLVGADGVARLRLFPGRWQIVVRSASASWRYQVDEPITIAPGERIERDVAFPIVERNVRCVAKTSGLPLVLHRIERILPAPGGATDVLWTNDQGELVLRAPPGSFELRWLDCGTVWDLVTDTSIARNAPVTWTVEGPTRSTVELRSAREKGPWPAALRVVAAADATPLATRAIELEYPITGGTHRRVFVTDASGRLDLVFWPCTVRVRALEDAGAPASDWADVHWRANGPETNVVALDV